MKADLLCIGSELLTGLVENTNAGYLARRLGSAGIEIREQRVVADELDTIAAAIAEALRQSEIVICTGGLGPTDDDMTREAAAKLLQREFTADPNWLRKLACFFGERGLTMPEANRKQAMVINGSTLLDNSRGTAPGAMVETDGRLLFLLPGPPQELQPMFEETVLPVLKSRVKDEIFLVKTVKCSGLGESLLEEKLKTLDKWENPALSLAARGTEVHLQLKARGGAVFAQKLIAEATRRLYHALAGFVYGEDEETLAGVVAALFVQSQKTLALAESCSGGLLADLLTDVPGSSRFFKGSLVAYNHAVKESILGVDRKLLEREGAVSEAAARAMALAVRQLFNTDIGIGITGVAGPASDAGGRPIGLVYVALAGAAEELCRETRFVGTRKTVKTRAAQTALTMLWRVMAAEAK